MLGIIKIRKIMKNCYESFLRWLTLWLSEDSRMYFHLTESSYESLDGEFWAAIAPITDKDSRFDRLRDELMRVYLQGIHSRAMVITRRRMRDAHLVES